MTSGAPYAHSNSAKGQLQGENRNKLVHVAMATAATARYSFLPF
jgi:hypothetical protein